ncbi:hypothetical protein [Bordetella sp. LUAb4]|uniref:hypothetical protein n=1 Tax=Bordetella sp. LUAb4 TaxID=2843195 RepID=UPI001E3D2B37|nr:hypothetical protein [Bordetella sp. LUAb4]
MKQFFEVVKFISELFSSFQTLRASEKSPLAFEMLLCSIRCRISLKLLFSGAMRSTRKPLHLTSPSLPGWRFSNHHPEASGSLSRLRLSSEERDISTVFSERASQPYEKLKNIGNFSLPLRCTRFTAHARPTTYAAHCLVPPTN